MTPPWPPPPPLLPLLLPGHHLLCSCAHACSPAWPPHPLLIRWPPPFSRPSCQCHLLGHRLLIHALLLLGHLLLRHAPAFGRTRVAEGGIRARLVTRTTWHSRMLLGQPSRCYMQRENAPRCLPPLVTSSMATPHTLPDASDGVLAARSSSEHALTDASSLSHTYASTRPVTYVCMHVKEGASRR